MPPLDASLAQARRALMLFNSALIRLATGAVEWPPIGPMYLKLVESDSS